MVRKLSSGWLPDDSKADREAVGGIHFLQIPLLAWTLAVICLPLEVLVFWGTWNPWRQVCFSAGALAYGLWIGIHGWVPWKMTMLRTIGGIDPERWEQNPTAVAVTEFVLTPRVRWTAAAIAMSGALNPWLLTGVSTAAGGKPFNDPEWLPASGALMFGLMDSLRGGSLGVVWIIRRIRLNWPQLRAGRGRINPRSENAEEIDSDLPQNTGDFLEKRNVKKSTALSWYLLGLVILGSFAYVRGCLRRHGYLP
jgi:hypothetical protein